MNQCYSLFQIVIILRIDLFIKIYYYILENIKIEKEKELQRAKEVILVDLDKLKTSIKKYLETEPSHEYYRYIFAKEFKCENPVVTLELKTSEKLFKNILELFRHIEKNLFFTIELYHLL